MSLFSLSIVTPLALLGLLAMAIPIYLHMRHKPRAEIQSFPALEFLLKAQRKRKRRFRVEQLLLMLFRLAIVGALALLFAKPFIDETLGNMGLKQQTPLIILLDDSASMLAQQGDARFFDDAMDQIQDLISSRPSSSPTVLLMASKPSALMESKTAGELKTKLSQVKPTALAATLDEAYAKAMELVAIENWQQASLRIYTDGSQTAWKHLPSEKPESIEVVYASLRKPDKPLENLGLAEVKQAPGDRRTIEVALQNGGSTVQDATLKMNADGNVVSQPMRVNPFARMSHRFGLGENMPDNIRFSLPADDFDLDNEVVFSPGSAKAVNVLIVDGDSHPEAVASEAFFFKNAIGMEESEKYGFEHEVVTPAGLNSTNIAKADVICLFNVDALDHRLLTRALAMGKGVFVSMGSLVEAEAWKPFFAPYEIEIWETKTLQAMAPIEIRAFDHPFFQPIEESEWRSYLQGAGISKYRILTTGRSEVTIPLALPDGTPLLLAKDTEPGRLMIWASSIDLDWTNFPIQFGYVPFVRQILAYLSDQGAATTVSTLRVDDLAGTPLEDELALKQIAPGFEGLAIAGPVPGIYTRQVNQKTEFVQIAMDPGEMNFQTFDDQDDSGEAADQLAKIGFQDASRADLGPSIQWMIFILLLVETLVAGRLSLKWGGR